MGVLPLRSMALLSFTLAAGGAPMASARPQHCAPTPVAEGKTAQSVQTRKVSLRVLNTSSTTMRRDLQLSFEEPVRLVNITLIEGSELLRDDGREVYEETQTPLAFAYERDSEGCSQLFFAESEGAFGRPAADLTLTVRFRAAGVADTEEEDEVIFRVRSRR